jgi:hypothetical protein
MTGRGHHEQGDRGGAVLMEMTGEEGGQVVRPIVVSLSLWLGVLGAENVDIDLLDSVRGLVVD